MPFMTSRKAEQEHIATGVLAPDQLLNTRAAINESTAMLRSNPPRK
jgi:hypothetical protein